VTKHEPGTAIVPLSFSTPRLDLGMPRASLWSVPPSKGNSPKNWRCLSRVLRDLASGLCGLGQTCVASSRAESSSVASRGVSWLCSDMVDMVEEGNWRIQWQWQC
jgi:hypothetical protein